MERKRKSEGLVKEKVRVLLDCKENRTGFMENSLRWACLYLFHHGKNHLSTPLKIHKPLPFLF